MASRRPASGAGGFALIEAVIAILLVAVVLVGAGVTYLVAERSFKWGSKKLVAQQEATLLARAVTFSVRRAKTIAVYDLPDRDTALEPGVVGDGVFVTYHDGTTDRFEWNADEKTLVDEGGKPVTSMELAYATFERDPVDPHTLVFKFATVDGVGNLVDMETAAAPRNASGS
jgi:hypothetical protein